MLEVSVEGSWTIFFRKVNKLLLGRISHLVKGFKVVLCLEDIFVASGSL